MPKLNQLLRRLLLMTHRVHGKWSMVTPRRQRGLQLCSPLMRTQLDCRLNTEWKRRLVGAVLFRVFFLWAAIIAVVCSFPAPASAAGLKKLRFLPQWQPQAQFAGYYVAKDKGIYEKYGIDLIILGGGPDYPPSVMLAKGKADIATMFLSEAIQKRAGGIGLVNIGQIVQHSGFMLVAKKSSGILSPKDLNGKKVSLWPNFQIQAQAFFRKNNVKAIIVPQASTVNLFLRGGVAAASAMWYNEYHTILDSGIDKDELTTFFFDQHGLNFPEDGIYALDNNVNKDKALYCNFVKASIEGWRYAFEHPDEALDIVMKYIREAQLGTNRAHQKWMLERMKDIIVPKKNGVPLGRLSERDYAVVARALKANGLIKNIPNFQHFYKDCENER